MDPQERWELRQIVHWGSMRELAAVPLFLKLLNLWLKHTSVNCALKGTGAKLALCVIVCWE